MNISQHITNTLRAQEHGHQPIVFEPGIASRDGGHIYKGVSGTLRATPGDNRMTVCLKIRGGVEVDSLGKKAGKGALIQWNKSATLGVNQDQTLITFALKETGQDLLTEATDTKRVE